MDVIELKNYILDNDLVEYVLSAIGCNHIRNRGEYISASNPDGDNPQAIIIYLNDNLTCINYTRQISKNKRATDIFDLVSFFEQCTFPEAMKFVCDSIGVDYYREPDDIPESLQILKMLKGMSIGDSDDDNEPLKPIPEEILSYYIPLPNKMFEDDNIPLEVQCEFEVGYDPQTDYITIPIRDELGNFVGVKGRYFGIPDESHTKYTYIEKCNKSKLLYGYYQNKAYIKNNSYIYVVESEKSVMQLAGMGIRNVISTGGKTISKYQVELITRTGCTPIFAFDKDVEREELLEISSKFIDGIDIYALIDDENILDEKESPSDNSDKWMQLTQNCLYKLTGDKNAVN